MNDQPKPKRSLELIIERGLLRSIKVDGKDVQYVTSITLSANAESGSVPKATIEVLAIDAYIKMDETDVEIRPRVVSTSSRRDDE